MADYNMNGEESGRICLGALYGQIEEAGGRRVFSLLIENSGIYEYEKKILSGGQVANTLQTAFMMLEGKEKLFYDFTGYCQLREYLQGTSAIFHQEGEDRLHLDRALDVLMKVLQGIKVCEEHLLLADRIPMSPETIFIDIAGKDISFAFMPYLARDFSPQGRVVHLLEQMILLYDSEETSGTLQRIKAGIEAKNPGIEGIVTMVATIQREMNFNYWTRQNLRRAPERKEGADVGEPVETPGGLQLNARRKRTFNPFNLKK